MFKNIKQDPYVTLASTCQKKVAKKNSLCSAFSLIEVLVALLIFSIGALGISGMLLVSTTCYQKAEWREQVLAIAWSIAESLSVAQSEQALQANMRYWQERLEVILPGNVLTISRENKEGKNFYLIRISLGSDVTKTFELWIYTS